MKTNLILSVLFILFTFFSNSQTDDLILENSEFKSLIGKEYSEISELGDYSFKTRSSRTLNEVETSSTCLVRNSYQIYTSESVRIDTKSNKKVRKILDIIVLKGSYSSCEGCLLSGNINTTIKSIHLTKNISKESLLFAFEKNYTTGLYKRVNFDNYKWNPKSNRLKD